MPNRPRDQDCAIQIICVGIRVDIDAVVRGYLASGMENFLVSCRKSAQNEILGVLGEVEGPISGHLKVKNSKDWYCCLCMVPNQDTEALLDVWLTGWSLTTSITARGGR